MTLTSTHEELIDKLDALETAAAELRMLVDGAITEEEAKKLLADNIDDAEGIVEELKILAEGQG